LRPDRFVTRKIVDSACRIAKGSSEKLKLGNIAIERDWGWAPEYVEAMWLMLQQEEPDDYVIATGTSRRLEEFIDIAFTRLGLKWHDHVVQEPNLFRPSDFAVGRANPSKAKRNLGWQAKLKLENVVERMVDAQMSSAPMEMATTPKTTLR
jgi:GDPmannose 4,6-dehydratase